jgi:predicted DNA-binding transcriptional regulator AlpA
MNTKRPQLWEGCDKDTPVTAKRPEQPSITLTDEEAVAVCFTKKTVCEFLSISTRTWDRLAAQGMVPAPDLIVGSSARWSRDTITRWLRSKPRLPGRGKRGEA